MLWKLPWPEQVREKCHKHKKNVSSQTLALGSFCSPDKLRQNQKEKVYNRSSQYGCAKNNKVRIVSFLKLLGMGFQ